MAENEEKDKGFKVTDRRISYSEEDLGEEKKKEEAETASRAPEQKTPEPPSAAAGEPTGKEEAPKGGYPPVDFTQFVLSLGSSAMLQLGEAPHPADGQYHTDIEGARQTIDILGMLEEKTRGNLNREEENLLKNILADLRIRFVKKQSP